MVDYKEIASYIIILAIVLIAAQHLNVVVSGSMEPAFYRGDIVLVEKADFLGIHEFNPKDVKVGDVVYIYVGAPEKRICYKAVVEKINIPLKDWFDDKPYNIPPATTWFDEYRVRLKITKTIDADELKYSELSKNGLSVVNWISELKADTIKYIEEFE